MNSGCAETPRATNKVTRTSYSLDQEAQELEKIYGKLKAGLLEKEFKEVIGMKPFAVHKFIKAGKRELYLIDEGELDSKGADYFETLKEVTKKGKPVIIVEFSAFGDVIYIAKRIINKDTIELEADRFWFFESNVEKPETPLKDKDLDKKKDIVKKFTSMSSGLSQAWKDGGDRTLEMIEEEIGGGAILNGNNDKQKNERAFVFLDSSSEIKSWEDRDKIFFKRPKDKTRDQIIVWSDESGAKSATLIHWQKIEMTNDGEVLAYWTESDRIKTTKDLEGIEKTIADQKTGTQSY